MKAPFDERVSFQRVVYSRQRCRRCRRRFQNLHNCVVVVVVVVVFDVVVAVPAADSTLQTGLRVAGLQRSLCSCSTGGGLLLPLWRGLLVTSGSCAKTDEPIDMPFRA